MSWRTLPFAVLWLVVLVTPAEAFRAAIYETWNATAWSGKTPHYTPTLGLYSSLDPTVVSTQLDKMGWGKINVAIVTDWDRRNRADSHVSGLLSTTSNAGSPVKWTPQYAGEGNTDPHQEQIDAVLDYAADVRLADLVPEGGKPVIFVRTGAADNCSTADRWAQAKTRFYVSLKIFTGYRTCASQPDSWHQYTPNKRTDSQRGFSYSISPKCWGHPEATPRLERRPFRSGSRRSRPWSRRGGLADRDDLQQLGRRTSVEPALEWTPAGCAERITRSADAPASTSTCCARTASPRRPRGPEDRRGGRHRVRVGDAGHEQLPPGATSDIVVAGAYKAVLPWATCSTREGHRALFKASMTRPRGV